MRGRRLFGWIQIAGLMLEDVGIDVDVGRMGVSQITVVIYRILRGGKRSRDAVLDVFQVQRPKVLTTYRTAAFACFRSVCFFK